MADATQGREPGQGRRVALLARPGPACDQLRAALDVAGAQCVLQADPTELDPTVLLEAGPQMVLVALDPVTEEALERFDAILGGPTVDVIYEEADLAAARTGWDAARWQRHLVAKLHGHRDVLPPGRLPGSPDLAAAAAHAPSLEADSSPASTNDMPAPTAAHAEPGADEVVVAAAASRSSFGELSLDDGDAVAAADSQTHHEVFRQDMDDLQRRISTLELVDEAPVRGADATRGAVLLLAGLGGPDAVRQVLGALPAQFGRPVLVQQRLDGGRYDKLVTQMQRATALPVNLAEPGQPAAAGNVYILASGTDVTAIDDRLQFSHGDSDLLAALPAADSAVLLLSGSDPDRVDAVMNHSWAGALVAGQAAEGCYDAAAANALAARGGEIGTPAQLAAKLAERWPATEAGQP